MNLRKAITNLLSKNDRLVNHDYPLTHFNVVVFESGNIATNESSYSTYTVYDTKPLLVVSLRYARNNEIDAEDFEESDYDELIDEAIARKYQEEETDIDLDEFLNQEYK